MFIRRRRSPHRPLVLPFLGYGTDSKIHLTGRVLADNGISEARDTDPFTVNVVNMVKRYTRPPVIGATLSAQFQELEQAVTTDAKGYFELDFALNPPRSLDSGWQSVSITLSEVPLTSPVILPEAFTAVGQFLIPSAQSQFGVISDIDDTVLRTDILNVVRMIGNTFLYNAQTRLPFKGVAAFYDALHKGTVTGAFNPIYYVSNSAWTLYDVIVGFFTAKEIPLGPLFMSTLGVLQTAGRHDYKIDLIQNLLDTYPHLPFILLGDSGQQDPELYLEILQKNPGRIRTIYIRDVTGSRRARAVRELIVQVATLGAEMLFIEDTVAASDHALAHGYIKASTLPDIAEEKAKDQTPAPLTPA